MSEIVLERFSINRLNGEYNVDLKIVDNIKIIVAENGSGKTTILNVLYLFLTKNKKIFDYEFYFIEIVVNGKEYKYYKELLKIVFNSDVMSDLNGIDKNSLEKFSKSLMKFENIDASHVSTLFLIFFCKENSDDPVGGVDFKRDYLKSVMSAKRMVDDFFNVYRLDPIEFNYKILEKSIEELFLINKAGFDLWWLIKELENGRLLFDSFENIKIIYLPTYRIVENSISSFSNKEEEDYYYSDSKSVEEYFKNKEIKFGAKDIEKVWVDLLNQIKASTSEGFLKTSAKLLKNIVNDRKIKKSEINSLIKNKKSIDKVISRLDKDVFDEKDRTKIQNLIDKNFSTYIVDDSSLFYILENMVAIYDSQKNIDEAISKYCNAVNSFLINKKIIFNEQISEIYVQKNNMKKISIEKLSSGEKQMLLIFTKLYLTNIKIENNDDEKYWIIYDEPEISLSIEWQMLLLPKILESNKCEFLLSATHSPFVFKNELRKYTSDLSLDISESN